MSQVQDQTLAKEQRLTKAEVSAVFNDSKSSKSKLFVVKIRKNDLEFSRIAAIASKKAGIANKRVTIRRRIRAAYRLLKNELPCGYDIAIIARYGVLEADFEELCRQLKETIKNACEKCAN